MHSLGVAGWGRTQWRFVSFKHPLAHEERCWRECNGTRAL